MALLIIYGVPIYGWWVRKAPPIKYVTTEIRGSPESILILKKPTEEQVAEAGSCYQKQKNR